MGYTIFDRRTIVIEYFTKNFRYNHQWVREGRLALQVVCDSFISVAVLATVGKKIDA